MAKKESEIKEEKIDLKKLKKELSDYIDKEIKDKYNEEIDKANKRVVKRKNRKILVRNILIVILLGIILYLLYLLNKVDYFDKYFLDDNEVEIEKNTSNEENNTSEDNKEVSLDDLKKEYSFLLDNISINENSTYIKDYYSGNLTTELKNYLSLNNLNIDELTKENDYNIIEENLLKKSYETLFNDKYTSSSFKYNGNNIRYISSLKSYISDKLIEESNTNIKRVITSIDTDDDEIKIDTTEGLIKDKKVYNVLTKEEIGEDKEETFIKNADKLNKITYTFDKGNKLIKIKNN